MFPTINGKSIMECTEADLQIIIENPDYRESDFLDYKASFSFLEVARGDPKREERLAEFRSDVCSFANAFGGFIIYGISDDRGMAKSINGIDIENDNIDRFELDRKNNLNAIMPKMPSVKFHFIRLENGKYVVSLFVQRDTFAPYVHREHESSYRIFKRVGNGKQSMSYVELKQMFNQSLSLEESILSYRKDRTNYFREQEDTPDLRFSKFMLVHLMPDTFKDPYHNKSMFALLKKNSFGFSNIFEAFGCNVNSIPNVDGLRYVGYNRDAECLIGNSGIVECYYPLQNHLHIGHREYPNGFFPTTFVWEKIESVVRKYASIMLDVLDTRKIFIGISIMGCKGILTENNFWADYLGYIDRNTVICNPVKVDDISEPSDVDRSIKLLKIEFALALGVKHSKDLNQLVEEMS